MPYSLLHTNGTTLLTVQDGTIDTTTSLTFTGRNYTGYGQIENENFVKLLENFCNSTQPKNPMEGQLWFNATTNRLQVYDGNKFKMMGVVDYSSAYPSGMSPGDMHFDATTNILSAYAGNNVWVAIGPTTTDVNANASVLTSIFGSDSNYHPVVETTISGTIASIVSTSLFSPANSNPTSLITNYPTIYPGFTLPGTNTSGVSAYSSSTVSGYVYWGTAGSSFGLSAYNSTGGYFIPSSDVTRTSILSTAFPDPIVVNNTSGLTIGVGTNMQLYISSGVGVISMGAETLNINVNNSSGVNTNMVSFDGSTGMRILPNPSQSVTIGSPTSGYAFNNIYVSTVTAGAGNFSGSVSVGNALSITNPLTVANGGTGVRTLTGYVYGNGTNAMTASTTIPISAVSGTVNGSILGNITGVLYGNGSSNVSAATQSQLVNVIGSYYAALQGNSGVSFYAATVDTRDYSNQVANTYWSGNAGHRFPVSSINVISSNYTLSTSQSGGWFRFNASGGVVAMPTSQTTGMASFSFMSSANGNLTTTDGSQFYDGSNVFSNYYFASGQTFTVAWDSQYWCIIQNGGNLNYQARQRVYCFQSSGTTNWTCPLGVYTVWIDASAGGGGGGYKGGGGGGGASMFAAQYSVTPNLVYQINIGAGGGPGSSGATAGGDGYATYMAQNGNNLWSLPAGHGGGGGNNGSGGAAGGQGSQAGQAGTYYQIASGGGNYYVCAGGAGGSTIFGNGGAGGIPTTGGAMSAAPTANAFGTGGGGGEGPSGGCAGFCKIYW